MRFRAFLSYSHADAEWARWLLRRLETYRVPKRLLGTRGAHGPIEARLGRFFRDRDELPSSGDLGSTIREALAQSEVLIVVCSPAAAQSRWVNAEVEAFRACERGERVLCFIVGGDPGSADAARQCFPPAVTQAAGGRIVEPLAADARREGDGRERAFLKLVAGLLGIGYDELAQREAQRRQRRWALAAAASLAGMALALGLAVTAWMARNDAQRRQAQAEDILGFMLGDLRKKLSTVGRLDLMRAVDDKATTYFATLDPRDLSDRALEEQARSLTGIGQVRLDEGNHDAAMAALREAHARSSALSRRAPGNGQRLYDLAQAEFWIGLVAMEQGRYDEAGAWFRRYRDSAIRLAAIDRGNFEWQREVAYGYHNLATLDERLGHFAEAERSMRSALDLRRGWLAQRPADVGIRESVATTVSWLGTVSARQGKLADAENFFREQVVLMQQVAAAEPKNAEWKEELIDALLLLTEAQAQRGQLANAVTSVRSTIPLADALARQDPANNGWQATQGICRWWLAQLSAATGAAGAATDAAQATALLLAAHRKEAKDDRVLRWLARSRNLQAQIALAAGDARAAHDQLAQVEPALAAAFGSRPSEALRIALAENHLSLGEVEQAAGNLESAQAHWRESEQLLSGDAGERTPFSRLDPLVRSLQHLDRHADASVHEQRLRSAGYAPLRPFPASNLDAPPRIASGQQ